jgi:GT2 family glycosyltransferase
MNPQVTVIVLNWNARAITSECLESLRKVTYPDYTVLCVDNGSTDGSIPYMKELHPHVEFIANTVNLGFAGGNNVGMRSAMEKGSDYVLLLNNDTEVDPNFLSELINVAEGDPKIGIVGSKICYYDEPGRLWFGGGHINFWSGNAHHMGERELDDGRFDRTGDTDYITGCSMLIKRKVLEDIGLLDESYFLYYEDSDFCSRARKRGYRLVYAPASLVLHKVSSTTGKVKDLQLYYGTRNMLIFEKRNAGLLHLAVFLPYYFGKFVIYNTIAALAEGNLSRAKTLLKAAYEGITR